VIAKLLHQRCNRLWHSTEHNQNESIQNESIQNESIQKEELDTISLT